MRLRALVDGQPAIVAVESCLASVRGCEDRRNHSEVERRYDVLTGDPLATVIADRGVILATGLHHVNRRHVVVQRRIRIYGFARRPGGPSVGRFRQLNVVLIVTVILPDRKQVPVRAIDPEPGEVVGANVWTRYAFLAPTTEVAQWLADKDIVTDLRGCPAVQMRHSSGRAAARVAVDSKLLPIGVAGRGIAVVEA